MKRTVYLLFFLFFVERIYPIEPDIFGQVVQKRKSFIKAVGLSILCPGLGEYYLGEKNAAYSFFAAETGIQSLTIFFYARGKWTKEDYISYAVSYAGINPENKDEKFFERLGFYLTRDQYNFETLILKEDFSLLYPESDEFAWRWENTSYMEEYHRLWVKSKTAYRNATIMLAVAGVNRVLSVIDLFRIRFTKAGKNRFTIKTAPLRNNGDLFRLSLVFQF